MTFLRGGEESLRRGSGPSSQGGRRRLCAETLCFSQEEKGGSAQRLWASLREEEETLRRGMPPLYTRYICLPSTLRTHPRTHSGTPPCTPPYTPGYTTLRRVILLLKGSPEPLRRVYYSSLRKAQSLCAESLSSSRGKPRASAQSLILSS